MGTKLSTNEIKTPEIALYPNPVHETLNFSETISNMKISEPSGKLVIQIFVSGTSMKIGKLRKDVYYVTFSNRYGEIVTKKIVKE